MSNIPINPSLAPPTVENTVLLVLCGGKGTRMGGEDKPLLPWRNKAMVDHVLGSVPKEMANLISANRNTTEYARRAPVVEDTSLLRTHNFSPSPLVGILAGLHSLAKMEDREWLLVSPGDTPALPRNWWEVLQNEATAEEPMATAVVAFDGKRQQHLHLLLHERLAQLLLSYLKTGEIAVYQWLAQIGARPAEFAAPDAFRNINQPQDLAD